MMFSHSVMSDLGSVLTANNYNKTRRGCKKMMKEKVTQPYVLYIWD